MWRSVSLVRRGSRSLRWPMLLASALLLAIPNLILPNLARAEPLRDALVRAYQTNLQLNAERARLRGIDETVPQALAGYRPQVSATLTAGLLTVRNLLPDGTIQSAGLRPWTIGLTVSQTLFNGFRTANLVRQAEAQVRSGREALRNVGQSVLLDAVTVYANVLANQTLVEAQRVNVGFLRELVNTTRRRLDAGDVRPTDVAQADARFRRGLADLNTAEVNLAVSQALYAKVIGIAPSQLVTPAPLDSALPSSREEALAASLREHPAILAAAFDVDTADFAIRIAESNFFPQLTIQGSILRSANTDTTLGTTTTDQAAILGQATVPLYDGGLASAQTRQAKELATQARLVLEFVRSQAQTAVITAWVTFDGARIAVAAGEAELVAAQLALTGVQREAQAGGRTTLDVLNAQQDAMLARSRMIQAQRDRVIASYTLMAAVGRLDVKFLKLDTPEYAPETNYFQVRDVWQGMRIPSGQ